MSVPTIHDWDHADTVRYYEAFCARHSRYEEANRRLVEAAGIRAGMQLLDVGAGTGRTAESALRFLGDGRISCVEPARAMREAGQNRLKDSRITWAAEIPDSGAFDRILWGAGIWQAAPLGLVFKRLAGLLNDFGALCFNLPSLYLGIPDEPGGGPDPLLLELPGLLSSEDPPPIREAERIPHPNEVESLLENVGLSVSLATFRIRITQECKRDWMKIPVMTDRLMPFLTADKRAARIDEVYATLAPGSWMWEGWHVWSASK